jgi:hypothetical protein
MTLTTEIKKNIDAFSRQRDSNQLFSYVKGILNNNKATAKDVFEYARDYHWEKEKPIRYVIDEFTINLLGVVVHSLNDPTQNCLSVQFYKLAAERGSSWGNSNYAQSLLTGDEAKGVKKDLEQALIYAQKAVDLCKSKKDEEHEHKFLLANVLFESKKKYEVMTLLLKEYVECKAKELASNSVNANLKEKIKGSLTEAIALCETFLTGTLQAVEAEAGAINIAKINETLEPLIKCTAVESARFRSNTHYIKGRIYEISGQRELAMECYCLVTQKQSAYYLKAIEARSRLLKMQVNEQDQHGYEADTEIEEENNMLPGNIPFRTDFSKHWKKEAAWFYSVDIKNLQAANTKYADEIDSLIAATRVKIQLIQSQLVLERSETLITSKNLTEKELEQLIIARGKIDDEYSEYTAEGRQSVRRYGAERRFFDPKRSSKKTAIATLTSGLVDQRFQAINPAQPQALPLEGYSARIVITAERAFQTAAIELAGRSAPMRCMPMVQEKPWQIRENGMSGTNKYGPTEHYRVGETVLQTQHRFDPKHDRLGDSLFPKYGNYDSDIYLFLRRMSGQEAAKEKKLAEYMLRFSKKHQGISLEELQAIFADADKQDVDQFNHICFLIMEKEQGQWHSATSKSFHIGMTVAQARSLIMLEAGFLSFEDVFRNNVIFGVYSKTNIINYPVKVLDACQKIDELYTEYLKTKHQDDYLKFFKKKVAEKSERVCVLTRHQAREDLQYVYGGESDTDHQGYQSNLSN